MPQEWHTQTPKNGFCHLFFRCAWIKKSFVTLEWLIRDTNSRKTEELVFQLCQNRFLRALSAKFGTLSVPECHESATEKVAA
jgi:hypothetical protein